MLARLQTFLVIWIKRLEKFFKKKPNSLAIELGRRGEELAIGYLKKKNFKILAKNWKKNRCEIDIVCYENTILVFVEARARKADALVPGYYTIGLRKKRSLRKACYSYLKAAKPKYYRFDVVEIRFASNENLEPVINHYENVPLF